MTLPVLPAPRRRRGRSVQRASPLISRVRLAASFVLLLTGAGLHSLTTSPVFALDPGAVSVDGLRYTDPDTARAALALPDGGNVFRLRTTDIERSLRELPAVRGAQVRVLLPDTVSVAVEERTPILAWRRGDTALLADVEGRLFAVATASDPLPTIDDGRTAGPRLAIGGSLAALDLEVARLLGAVRPSDVASEAAALSVSIDDVDGWVMQATGWRAVFGHYTVESTPPSDIEAQVACLRALLAGRERAVDSVTLALSSDACGTYRERTEPTATEDPSPDAGGRPSRRP
jgi:hypothetical protein